MGSCFHSHVGFKENLQGLFPREACFSFPPSQELCKSSTKLCRSGQSRERRVKSSPDLSNLCSILIKISLPLPHHPPSSTPQLRQVSLCYELASCLGHRGASRESGMSPTVGTCGRHIRPTPGAGPDTDPQCPCHHHSSSSYLPSITCLLTRSFLPSGLGMSGPRQEVPQRPQVLRYPESGLRSCDAPFFAPSPTAHCC